MRTDAPIPEFLKIASPDSGISTREITRILGVTRSRVSVLVKQGKFPKPDYKKFRGAANLACVQKTQVNYWRADTIRKFLREGTK